MEAHGHPERIHPNLTLAVLSVAGIAYAVLSSAVIPALPTIQHDLHTNENGVAWVLTGYLLSASVGTAIIGRLGDMYGKEHLLLWTLGLLAVGTALAGVAGSLVAADRRARVPGRRAAASSRSPSGSSGTSSRARRSPAASA